MRDEKLWQSLQDAPLLSTKQLHLPGTWWLFSKPLPAHIKTEVILEFKRFLYLLAVSHEPLMPSPFVAAALTAYLARSDKIHPPAFAQGALVVKASRTPRFKATAYRRCLALRASEFGGADPEHIWPGPLSLALQWVGWVGLATGCGMAFLAQLGADSALAALPFLILGGFLWIGEGPWPSNLPIARSFVARLHP